MNGMKDKINQIQNLGYKPQEVINMTKSFPALYSYSIESMIQKITNLENLGYNQEDIINMTKELPAL